MRRRRAHPGVAVVTVLGVAGGLAAAGWLAWRAAFDGGPVRERCTATASGATTSLTPERAGNAATIAAVAVRRGLPARAATIGIATAIQESKLENIDYGDRDSVGLFQQRPSQGWGTVEEILDPVYSANAFYDVLVEIEGYETGEVTEVAQRVQRSAFPTAYADHEDEARLLASALSGYSPGGLDCALRPVPEGGDAAARARALDEAAQRETGRRAAGPADASGTTTYRLEGADAGRLGWSLAAWAVARAGALDVVEVRTDGRRWQRAEPGRGWTAADGVPAGTVEVVVAGAAT